MEMQSPSPFSTPPAAERMRGEKEQSSTPTTAKRKGFSFFVKRIQTSTLDANSAAATAAASSADAAPRRLSYQPRIKPPAAKSVEQSAQQYQQRDKSPKSSLNASTSDCIPNGDAVTRNQIKRKSTPGKIDLDRSAQDLPNISTSFPSSPQEAIAPAPIVRREISNSARSDENTPRAISPLNFKRRQPSHVFEGMLKSAKSRQPSWSSSDHGRSSRQGMRRAVSSPIDTQSSSNMPKAPIAGSKPVAPSFHPDAPEELKVKPPSDPVLLPYLSIPGIIKKEGGSDELLPSNHLSPTSPGDFDAERVLKSARIKHQRPGIKVRIITWNQGSSVPKGNLESLLGRVGEYIAPQEGWDESSDEEDDDREETAEGEKKNRIYKGMGVAGQEKIPRKDRIPPLPLDDAHPYHVVVVAGQECPWGDGKRIATGVGIAGELGDLGRSKSRAAQHLKDKNKEVVGKASKSNKEGLDNDKIASSAIEGEFPFSEVSNRSKPTTPLATMPATPGGGGGGAAGIGAWGIGGKGWSDMCEDWLCRGPLAQATATKGLAQASKAVTPSPLLTPLAIPDEGMSPMTSRATTPNPMMNFGESRSGLINSPPQISLPGEGERAIKPSLSNNIISQDHFYSNTPNNATLNVPRPRSISRRFTLANRSKEVLETVPALVEESQEENQEDLLPSSPSTRPLSPIKQSIDLNIRLPAHQNKNIPGKPHHRLGLHIPGLSAAHHVTVQSDGTPLSLGAYELVAKERCYMMYLAVYVWRGCLDRVVKTSQGHVKSGLLAGRVGNKGCVGISLKLGSSRLLFVNAHLAAHEGKIAERIANVEKIKKELKVDTFLPPEDPRNQADDVTEAFDYAFLMGDLNFRVDVTRQHADWLLMKKKYQDALAFDQLTKIMREQPQVFNGFQEAPITFPPTFKYDVLKTIKRKNEDTTRKLKAGSNSIKPINLDSQSIDASKNNILPLSSSVVSVDQTSIAKMKRWSNKGDETNLLRERTKEDVDDDASSFTSSAWDGSAPSVSAGNTSEREERRGSLTASKDGDASCLSQSSSNDPVVSNNTAIAEGHKIHGKVIKAKRRFFDVVHSIGAHAQRKEEDYVPEVVKIGRKIKQEALRKQSDDNKKEQATKWGAEDDNLSSDRNSRRDSYASIGEVRTNLQTPISAQRRSSAGEIGESSPIKGDFDSSVMQPSSSVSTMTEEYDRQPYDTSAKQRVPSWCDRVLWKSTIKIAEVEEDKFDDQIEQEISSNYGLSSRVGHALSSAIHSNRRHHLLPRYKTEVGSPSVTFATIRPSHRQSRSVTSPPIKDHLSLITESQYPLPRKGWFNRRNSGQTMNRANTMDPRDFEFGSNKKSTSADHIPALLSRSQSTRSNIINGRDTSLLQPSKSSLEVPRQRVASPLHDEGTKDLMKEVIDGKVLHQQNNRQNNSAYDFSKVNSTVKSTPAHPDHVVNKRTSWWYDLGAHLPNFLTSQGAFSALTPRSAAGLNSDQAIQHQEEEEQQLIGPKRGQIECLSYRSLTDAEMRALDARSDHYAVYGTFMIGF